MFAIHSLCHRGAGRRDGFYFQSPSEKVPAEYRRGAERKAEERDHLLRPRPGERSDRMCSRPEGRRGKIGKHPFIRGQVGRSRASGFETRAIDRSAEDPESDRRERDAERRSTAEIRKNASTP